MRDQKKAARGIVSIATLLLLWEGTARAGLAHPLYFPPASKVLATTLSLWSSLEFLTHIGASAARMVAGYVLAALIATVFGVWLGSSRLLYSFLEPLIELLRPLPSVAVIPIAILFLGVGDVMKIFVIVYAATWPALLNTIEGVRGGDPVQIDTGRIFGLSEFDLIREVRLPNALPHMFTGLRISLAIALILTITSEMVGGSEGLGYFILYTQRTFQIPEMYAGIATVALLGFSANAAFSVVESRLLAWHRAYTRQQFAGAL